MSNKPVLCIQVNEETQLRLFEELYLSMILGANFESESGPEIPLPTSLIIKFGGHLTPKKGSTWLLLTKKRVSLRFGEHSLLDRRRAIKPTHRSQAKLSSERKRGGASSSSCSTSKNGIR